MSEVALGINRKNGFLRCQTETDILQVSPWREPHQAEPLPASVAEQRQTAQHWLPLQQSTAQLLPVRQQSRVLPPGGQSATACTSSSAPAQSSPARQNPLLWLFEARQEPPQPRASWKRKAVQEAEAVKADLDKAVQALQPEKTQNTENSRNRDIIKPVAPKKQVAVARENLKTSLPQKTDCLFFCRDEQETDENQALFGNT